MSQQVGEPGARLPVAILISGRGSNMQAIARRAASGELPVEVRVVVSDQPTAPGLAIAREMGLETQVLSPREFADRTSYDRALVDSLSRYRPGLIVLAGFMRILTPPFIHAFAGRILNIHPSLLPKYRGLHTHRRVLEAGDKVHGVSVHFVTEELDGGPIIAQARVDVQPGDDVDTLSARVQREEHRIYPKVIDWFARGRLELRDGQVWLDGRALDAPVLDPA
ncbi:MAG TPA: phosphoribosylglycinamide formyltransferase [Steroidobacteraceae bacterium]